MPDVVTGEPEIGEETAEAGLSIEEEIEQVYGDVFPGEAIDIGIIISIITTLLGFIQQCRDSRQQQQRAVKRRARRARITAFRAVREQFPHKSRHKQLRLADALVERAASKPELFEELQDDAYSMGPGLIAI